MNREETQKELARLRTDAARYRWLREHREVLLLTGFFGNGCINRTIDEVDTAIDTEGEEDDHPIVQMAAHIDQLQADKTELIKALEEIHMIAQAIPVSSSIERAYEMIERIKALAKHKGEG